MTESSAPSDRMYTKSHEWVRTLADGYEVGITDHAQAELTDIVFVDLPKAGRSVKAGESVLVLESVKTVADVYAPFEGTILESNGALKDHPELVNQQPYGSGWLFRIRRAEGAGESGLLGSDGYLAFVASGAPAA